MVSPDVSSWGFSFAALQRHGQARRLNIEITIDVCTKTTQNLFAKNLNNLTRTFFAEENATVRIPTPVKMNK